MKIPAQPSVIFGTILMALGTLPMALWMADLVGLLELTRTLPEWSVIVMTMFGLSVGWMTYKGKGAGIWEAFTWWFKRGGHDHPHEVGGQDE